MADAFNRKYKLTLGRVGANNTVVITEQHIEFNIGQFSDSELNQLEVRIYNLSGPTIALLDKKDLQVQLEAGYEGTTLGLLFRGTKTISRSYRSGPDIITHITAQEGAKEVRQARCNETLAKGVTLKEVIISIIKQGWPKYGTNLKGSILESKIFNGGYSSTGSPKCQLDSLTSAYGLEWSILHDNLIMVFPKNGTGRSQTETVILRPDTGLIGLPEKITVDSNNMDGDKKNTQPNGIRATSLLNHKLVAGHVVKLENTGLAKERFGTKNSLDGAYKIQKVTHSGSYEGNDWTTEIEAVIVK